MFPERKSDAMTVGQLTKRINKDKISKKESKIFFTLFNIITIYQQLDTTTEHIVHIPHDINVLFV